MSYRDTDALSFEPPASDESVDPAILLRVDKHRWLHNYPGRGFVHMTKAEWRRLPRSCKGCWSEGLADSAHRSHLVRVALIRGAALAPVYIIDSIRIDPPSRSTPRRAGS